MQSETHRVIVIDALLKGHPLRARVRPFAQLVQMAIREGKRQARLLFMTQAAAVAVHRCQRRGVAIGAQDAGDERVCLSQLCKPAEATCGVRGFRQSRHGPKFPTAGTWPAQPGCSKEKPLEVHD